MAVIICSVCIEPLVVTSESQVVSPPCGHVFHEHCLTNWLSEKPSCPSCRNKITNDQIKRVYLESTTISNGQSDEVASYVCQVDSMSFELKMKQKEIRDYKEKAIKDEGKKRALREEISKLEIKVRKVKTDYADAVNAQQSMLREMRSLRECLKETDKLKQDLETYKRLDTILFGSVESADSALKTNELDPDNLIMLVSSFKTALEETKQSVKKQDRIIQRLTTENIGYKSKVEQLTSQISTLERVRDTYRKKMSNLESVCSPATDRLETSVVASDSQPSFDSKGEVVASSSSTPDVPSPVFHPYHRLKDISFKRKQDTSPMLNRKIKIVSSRLKRPQSHS